MPKGVNIIKEQFYQASDILDICILAGELMLKNGAETYRVEDTVTRIARSYSISHVNVFVTPTAIIMTMQDPEGTIDHTELLRVVNRTIDLHKIALVNDLSRRIANHPLPLETVREQLEQIDTSTRTYPYWFQILSAALGSGCLMMMFNGTWPDFLPAFITGGIGYAVFLKVQQVINVKFFSEVFASFLIGLLAVAFVAMGVGQELDKIIIGSVMPLVPGLAITNAVRDLMAGHLLSGLSRGVEALLTATAIGSGVAIVITFL
ncbi:threonine/serine exporter family protein [Bacillus chungangensis]|uniref:Uncharacterized membrane protein YjjP (DUF1212 family) n=1 Tax=Bacillus chungangensis TaxID=587633 RepID=A0ABT9WPP2_9BACI|nr:threonine/serine exporter family protein [Bacillus chungangensis]MDQ0175254.1 uncharacterized membrane protein YjjP (DUF1212 family) [Bacillus chungangensis]